MESISSIYEYFTRISCIMDIHVTSSVPYPFNSNILAKICNKNVFHRLRLTAVRCFQSSKLKRHPCEYCT